MTFAAFANDVLMEIGDIPAANTDLKKHGMKRLEAAAQGLPITIDELAAFFADDLQSFGTGEVKQAGIVQAVRWYAFTHMQRSVYWWERDKPSNVVVLDEYRRSIR